MKDSRLSCTISRYLVIVTVFVLFTASSVVLAASDVDFTAKNPPANGIWLDSLDLKTSVFQDWGRVQSGLSVEGRLMKIKGKTYAHGIGTHSISTLKIILNGCAETFMSMVGLDDEVKEKGSVNFEVIVDGKKAAESGVMTPGAEPKLMKVDLKGAKELILKVTDAGDGIGYDHADWAGALLILVSGTKERPQVVNHPLLAPARIAHIVPSPKPAIHGPRIVGATPGYDFLFMVPATGEGPLSFSAKNLPDGLTIDEKTGIITGSIKQAGEYIAEITVKGPKGTDSRKLKIVGGDHKLALTPPLGWNSWNVWARAIDDAKVRDAADWMVKSGLAAHGFQYINIDDCWEADRDANGEIRSNEKFPDMKALGDYIHSKGLKFGIYSSPGPATCAGFEGSYQHEEQDAKTYAKWGIDYLKYDWCSYGSIAKDESLYELQKPYKVMREALDKCGRDIVYSLCQYGMGDVWKWGAEVGGNCWRTTGDIFDTWRSMASIGFKQDALSEYAGPGHWNDPDMLIVGKVGWGADLRDTGLRPNEQVTHITLWCMVASPLLIGCDMAQMDQLTLDLLTNDEVLDVNQDPLGKPARSVSKSNDTEVWARPLWDGTIAVALFNRSEEEKQVTAKWSDLGITGPQPVRDLWLQKDVGTINGSYTVAVPAHGAVLVKIGTPKRVDW